MSSGTILITVQKRPIFIFDKKQYLLVQGACFSLFCDAIVLRIIVSCKDCREL